MVRGGGGDGLCREEKVMGVYDERRWDDSRVLGVVQTTTVAPAHAGAQWLS